MHTHYPMMRARFDAAFALLVINFIPDANKAASEMRRVTRSGGAVATAMWDNTGAAVSYDTHGSGPPWCSCTAASAITRLTGSL
jgi:ubiquinone/menaquinone biosynthesis C-methylase UbiE